MTDSKAPPRPSARTVAGLRRGADSVIVRPCLRGRASGRVLNRGLMRTGFRRSWRGRNRLRDAVSRPPADWFVCSAFGTVGLLTAVIPDAAERSGAAIRDRSRLSLRPKPRAIPALGPVVLGRDDVLGRSVVRIEM